jgi:dTDP-4-amino-4,6-dideoxygalactose transaminase
MAEEKVMSSMQAALGLAQLERIEELIARKR